MAETVRDWIVDLSSSATGLNSNRWVKKGKVKEVSGGAGEAGFMLVECIVNGSARENMRQDTKDITELEPMAEKWILTGSSIDTPIRPRSRQGAVQATSPVQVGDTVGVKEPTWIVDLQGTATHVFVNWAVLKDT